MNRFFSSFSALASAVVLVLVCSAARATDYVSASDLKRIAVQGGTAVIVGFSPAIALVSTTGTSWVTSSQSFDGYGCYAVGATLTGFLAGDNSGRTWDSTDGLIWRGPYATGGKSISVISFGSSGGLIGGNDANYYTQVLRTTDGKTFSTAFTQGQGGYIAGAAFGNNRWVVVGYRSGSPSDRPLWLVGASNATLTEILAPSDAIGWGVAFGQGLFVAMTTKGIFTSPDGQTWTARSHPVATQSPMRSVSFNEGQFVATGESEVVLKSTDGVSWTVVSDYRADSSFYYHDAATFRGQIIGVGDKLITIFDGNYYQLKILQQPALASQSTSSVRLAVTAQGHGTLSYQWYRGSTVLSGATTSSYTAATSGSYSVRVTDITGTITSDLAAVTIGTQPLPTISGTESSTIGGSSALTATYTGTGPVSYQWLKEDAVLLGRTDARLSILNTQMFHQGSYTVAVTTPFGTFVSAAKTMTVRGTPAVPTAKLINLSVRASADASAPLIVGFAITGAGRSLLLRAIGPTLADFGVDGVMPDPSLQVFSGNTAIASNVNWSDVANPSALSSMGARLGAFALRDGSFDAALSPGLSPGVYTLHAKPEGTTAGGVTLAEVYDASPTAVGGLSNISTLSKAAAGDGALMAGFVITGNEPKTILIRGIGPALGAFGVTGILSQPVLKLVSSAGAVLMTNIGWSSAPNVAAIASKGGKVGAFSLTSGSADSAMYVLVDPGAYTVSVSPSGTGSGNALIEVYDIP